MKKNLSGILAITLALGLSAFTGTQASSSKTYDGLFWYDINGNPLNGGVPAAEPSTNCTAIGEGCARGFSSVPAHPATDTPQQTRKTN